MVTFKELRYENSAPQNSNFLKVT